MCASNRRLKVEVEPHEVPCDHCRNRPGGVWCRDLQGGGEISLFGRCAARWYDVPYPNDDEDAVTLEDDRRVQ